MDEKREISMEEILSSVDEIKGRVGEKVKGIVVGKSEDGLVVDFSGKTEGLVPPGELLRSIDDYSVGDELDLQVIRVNEEEGIVLLSERRPKYNEVLRKIGEIANSENPIVRGRIVGRVKGGYRVLIDGVVEAFLPGSQSLLRNSDPIPDEEFDFEIINFELRRRPNIVVSRKAIRDREIEKFFKEKNVGDVIEGTVESITDFGVFVEIVDGLSGLLPRSEVSYSRVASLKDMFEIGQTIKAQIINMDPENKKVTLSLKALQPDPWKEYVKEHNVGDVVKGEVTRITRNGFFVKLSEDVKGFVPIEEVFWSRRGDIRSVVRKRNIVELEIIEIEPEKRRIVLSYKRAKGDPWEDIEERYPVGSEVRGEVRRIVQGGVIVELEDGVSGFVPASELSWNYFEKIEDVVKPRRKVRVKVLDVDKENRRMRLSIKRAQRNPWEKVEKELERGSIVQGKVKKVLGSGAIVTISRYGVDAFLPNNHFEGELKEGDRIEAVVLRILDDERRGKRMIISVKELEERKAIEEYKKSLEKEKPAKSLGEFLKKGERNG